MGMYSLCPGTSRHLNYHKPVTEASELTGAYPAPVTTGHRPVCLEWFPVRIPQ
jgi:hypothetical protein